MAPLLPSESTPYTVTLPTSETGDERYLLNSRTGSATASTSSNIVVHGGFTCGLNLKKINVFEIEKQLIEQGYINSQDSWESLLSAEMFYLDVIQRKWHHLAIEPPEQESHQDGHSKTLKPKPRAFHSLTVFHDKLFIYGGLAYDFSSHSFVPCNDLWEFSIDSKRWKCLNDGSTSGMVSRFGHQIIAVDYVAPDDANKESLATEASKFPEKTPCLAIVGGRGELNQELNHVILYDLNRERYIGTSEMRLTLNEMRSKGNQPDLDPIAPSESNPKVFLKCLKETGFVIGASSSHFENDPNSELDESSEAGSGDQKSSTLNFTGKTNNDTIILYNPFVPSEEDEEDKALDLVSSNPLVSIPVTPDATGLRLPLSHSQLQSHNSLAKNSSNSSKQQSKANSSIPNNQLTMPSGVVFGSNIIVSGFDSKFNEYQVFSYNMPSMKWTRLNIGGMTTASTTSNKSYLWKTFIWGSHHNVIILGSSDFSVGGGEEDHHTVQKFDLFIALSLPIINIFHSFRTSSQSCPARANSNTNSNSNGRKKPSRAGTAHMFKETTNFEAYAKYVSPTTKLSSIRSIFPNYAVTLGRNSFERYGSYLADFEFISADGDKCNVPLVLLRKRWGRCFDMLLSRGYARAVYQLENNQSVSSKAVDSEGVEHDSLVKKSISLINKATTSMSPASGTGGATPSGASSSAAVSPARRNSDHAPQFRLPFQDNNNNNNNNSSGSSKSPQLAPAFSTGSRSGSGSVSAGPTSRKASVISTGNLSMTSLSAGNSSISGLTATVGTTVGGAAGDAPTLDFSNLPPRLEEPTESLPPLPSEATSHHLHQPPQFNSSFMPLKRDYLMRDHSNHSGHSGFSNLSPRNSPRGSVSGTSHLGSGPGSPSSAAGPGPGPGPIPTTACSSSTDAAGFSAGSTATGNTNAPSTTSSNNVPVPVGGSSTSSSSKLKDLRPANVLRRKMNSSGGTAPASGSSTPGGATSNATGNNSRSSSFQANDETQSATNTATATAEDQSNNVPNTSGGSSASLTQLMEPLLIPRSMYLPFSTCTVDALTEFFFTGQLGNKWLLTPTTTDLLLISKFYEIPLLYDLISEVMFAVLGKKEMGVMNSHFSFLGVFFGKLRAAYAEDINDQQNDPDSEGGARDVEELIDQFFLEHPHVLPTFNKIEEDLNTLDDGFLNLSLLSRRRERMKSLAKSRADSVSTNGSSIITGGTREAERTDSSSRHSSIAEKRKQSRGSGKIGKSRLSKQVSVEETEDDEDKASGADYGDDSEDESDIEPETQQSPVAPSKFNTDTTRPVSSYYDLADGEDNIGPKQMSRVSTATTSVANMSEAVMDDDDPLSIVSVSNSATRSAPVSASASASDSAQSPSRAATATAAFNKSRSGSEGESTVIQVPEGMFRMPKNPKRSEVRGYIGSDDEDFQFGSHSERVDSHRGRIADSTSSDSDSNGNMTFGLGLVGELKLKIHEDDHATASAAATAAGSTKPQVAENPSNSTPASTHDKSIATLENLAAPDALTPSDALIQLIYETAALACDMKLLLRSLNILELSHLIRTEREKLMKELDEYLLRFEEDRLRRKLQKREQLLLREERERKEMMFAMSAPMTAANSEAHKVQEFPHRRIVGEEFDEDSIRHPEHYHQQQQHQHLDVSDSHSISSLSTVATNGTNPASSTAGSAKKESKMKKTFSTLRSISSINLASLNQSTSVNHQANVGGTGGGLFGRKASMVSTYSTTHAQSFSAADSTGRIPAQFIESSNNNSNGNKTSSKGIKNPFRNMKSGKLFNIIPTSSSSSNATGPGSETNKTSGK
ncbi:hypothetical protein WICPIJ_005140 [Wickerhamomyces pijperi]|uniref:Uncharacterized protein n=1 Tax=Wickerhamomyces pijperi TaxID=599730 RepID=A0A9P8Q6T0_WICPI|nr:hypothetical protein WICPIJ_005140 [Wickerhamomyces pijperi]